MLKCCTHVNCRWQWNIYVLLQRAILYQGQGIGAKTFFYDFYWNQTQRIDFSQILNKSSLLMATFFKYFQSCTLSGARYINQEFSSTFYRGQDPATKNSLLRFTGSIQKPRIIFYYLLEKIQKPRILVYVFWSKLHIKQTDRVEILHVSPLSMGIHIQYIKLWLNQDPHLGVILLHIIGIIWLCYMSIR